MRGFLSTFPRKIPLSIAEVRSLIPLFPNSDLVARFRSPFVIFSANSATSSRPPSAATPPLCSSMAAVQKATIGAASFEEGIATRLWNKFRRESVLAMFTPFVVCLASGTLEAVSFRHYISQDVHFLKAFAQAYELAEDCVDEDDAKVALSELRKSVLDELTMHDSFAKEWDSDVGRAVPPNSSTVKYIDFLLATASGKVEGIKGPAKPATPFEKTKIASYTIGAMTPCMKLYAVLAKELLALLDHFEADHPYKKWINNYASDSFQASVLQIEDLLERLSVSLTGEELDIIEKLYHQALKLETQFFSAQTLAQQSVVPLIKDPSLTEDCLVVFSDFDLTCTTIDSSVILAETAIVTAKKTDLGQPENPTGQISSADLRKMWTILSTRYMEDYERCIEAITPAEKMEKFNYEDLSKAIEQLSDFEKRANSGVIDSGILKGLNVEVIERSGERMIFKDGCVSFFQKLLKSGNSIANAHVISSCWCGDLIRSAFSSGGLHLQNILANELIYKESYSTGEMVRRLETPLDKAKAFDTIIKDREKGDKKILSVYIGDSLGDLLCLLSADIGIVVGMSSSLRRVGSQFGVSFIPLFPGVVNKQKELTGSGSSPWKGFSGTLYTVYSWAEIQAFILGC